MPICAPVEGSPSPAISGHTPPTCSEVIRYACSGAGTGAHPRRARERPCLPTMTVNGSVSFTRAGAGASGGSS